MTPRPKQLVIDKCAFQKTGDRGDKLRSFAKNHLLILAHDLYGEIVTDRKDGRRAHLQWFQRAMQAGAYWGPSVRSMVEKEAEILAPYGFLADLDETRRMRDLFMRGRVLDPRHFADVVERNLESGKVLLDNHGVVCRKVVPQILECAEARRQELQPRVRRLERLQFLLNRLDAFEVFDAHAIAACAFRRYVRDAERFCLSREWVSWQYIRLTTVLHLEYAFLKKGQGGDGERETAEHDLYDVQYVVLLSRADAIITSDKKLVELARAAFPEKDVFSSLEEVPESYRCDWAGD